MPPETRSRTQLIRSAFGPDVGRSRNAPSPSKRLGRLRPDFMISVRMNPKIPRRLSRLACEDKRCDATPVSEPSSEQMAEALALAAVNQLASALRRLPLSPTSPRQRGPGTP